MKLRIYQFILPCVAFFGLSVAYALPNPATSYCASLGGKVETVKVGDGGEVGLCTFGDATVDQWTLFRYKSNNLPQMALSAFCLNKCSNPAVMIAHPELSYCESVGGESVQVTTAANLTKNLCYFKEDKSMIEQWTLFFGPQHNNLEFNRVLDCK